MEPPKQSRFVMWACVIPSVRYEKDISGLHSAVFMTVHEVKLKCDCFGLCYVSNAVKVKNQGPQIVPVVDLLR